MAEHATVSFGLPDLNDPGIMTRWTCHLWTDHEDILENGINVRLYLVNRIFWGPRCDPWQPLSARTPRWDFKPSPEKVVRMLDGPWRGLNIAETEE